MAATLYARDLATMRARALVYGPLLRAARRAKGWTQAELATRLGIAPGSVLRFEVGRRYPQPAMLKEIKRLLKVAPLAD